jgi:hypothetical protein
VRKLAYNPGLGSGHDGPADLSKKYETMVPPLTFIDDDETKDSTTKLDRLKTSK